MNKEDLETQCKLLCEACAENIDSFPLDEFLYSGNHVTEWINGYGKSSAYIRPCTAIKLRQLYKRELSENNSLL